MSENIICIVCPLGCSMDVEIAGEKVTKVTGQKCKEGKKYAQKEVFFPGRILTTTVKTDIPDTPLLPVRSAKEIPREKLMDCMHYISKQTVSGPVKLGQAIIEDVLGLGVDIIASRSVPF